MQIKSKRHPHSHPHARNHGTITQCCFNVGGQRQRLWVIIETSLGECHVFLRKVYSRPCDGLMLSQCRRRLTGLEPAMGCDALAQHWTGIWSVGLHPQYEVHCRQVLNECWPPPAMVVEEIHVEDIF